jgi:hypothetical protein
MCTWPGRSISQAKEIKLLTDITSDRAGHQQTPREEHDVDLLTYRGGAISHVSAPTRRVCGDTERDSHN